MTYGWTISQIDDVRLDDLWMLFENMYEEPPTHILMGYIAPTFGYKGKQKKKTRQKVRHSFNEAAALNGKVPLSGFGSKVLSIEKMPAHIRESARALLAEMKAG